MQNKKLTVLLSTIGCNTSISVAKSLKLLRTSRYRIVGVDMCKAFEAAGSHLCDAHYRVPAISDPSYIKTLLRICKKEGIDILMPVIDQDIEAIAQSRHLFEEQGITVCCNNLEAARICNDKYLTYTFLAGKGFDVPPALLKKDIRSGKHKMSYPVFIKPRRGASSIDCFRVDTCQELKYFMGRIEDPIVQPHLDGRHCVIDVVNGLDSKNIVAVPRYELSAKSGIGVKAVTVKDPLLVKYGRDISEAVGIQGPANIEAYIKNGRISLIEINCRYSAGHILTAVAGVNIPELVIDVFLKRPIAGSRLHWQSGFYMSRYWQEQFARNSKIIKG